MKKTFKKELLMILLLAAAVVGTRSYTWFNAYFSSDDVDNILEARDIYASGRFPVMGPHMSSSPVKIPGGGYDLLLSIPALLNASPQVFYIYSAVLILGAAALFLFTIKRHYGKWAAFTIASLLLFSTRFVLFEAGMTNGCYEIMLSMVLASILMEVFSGNEKPLLLFLILPLAALMAQVHIPSIFYIPLTLAAYFIFFYRGRNRSFFWLGITGAALLYVPYLVSEIGNHFSNTLGMLSSGPLQKGASFPALSYLLLFPSLDFMISGYISDGLRFLSMLPWYALWPLAAVYLASLGLAVWSLVFCVTALLRKGLPDDMDRRLLTIYFLTMASLILSFTIFRVPSYPTSYYYSAYAFSFFPLLVLLRRLNARLLLRASIAFIIGGSALTLYYFAYLVTPISIGMRYGYVNAMLDDAAGRPFEVRAGDDHYLYQAIAGRILHRQWNEKAGAALIYIIDKEGNHTNTGPARLIFGNGRMGLYRLR
jgi:hypothetical protein